MWTNWLALAGLVALSFTAAAIGGAFTAQSVKTWYVVLQKPEWTPPAWVFGPVWTVLYILIGVSAWLVWQRRTALAVAPFMTAWGVQLALNTGWSVIFFGLRQPGWACVEIALLWMAILVTLHLAKRAAPLAAGLLLPYFVWVSFASVLNFSIWRMN